MVEEARSACLQGAPIFRNRPIFVEGQLRLLMRAGWAMPDVDRTWSPADTYTALNPPTSKRMMRLF